MKFDITEIYALVAKKELTPEQALQMIEGYERDIRGLAPDIRQCQSGTKIAGVKKTIKEMIASLLKIKIEKIEDDREYEQYGLDSVRAVQFTAEINEYFQTRLDVIEILDHNTIEKLAGHIKGLLEGDASDNEIENASSSISMEEEQLNYHVQVIQEPIAVIHAEKEFDSRKFIEFWDLLKKGEIHSLKLSRISYSYYMALRNCGYRYMHLLIHNQLGDMAEIYAAGEGKPLVIITGVGMTPGFCVHQIMKLAEERQVICISMPGVGLSNKITDLSLERIGNYMMKTLKEIGVENQIDIIGLSWGSLVACTMAHQYADRIDKMILVAPNSNMVKNYYDSTYVTNLDAALEQDFLNVPGGKEANELYLKTKCIDMSAFALYGKYFHADSPSMHITYHILSEIRAETLIVWGDQDQIIQREDMELVLIRIPDAELVTIEGAGHIPMLTHHETFNKVAEDFLRGINGKGGDR